MIWLHLICDLICYLVTMGVVLVWVHVVWKEWKYRVRVNKRLREEMINKPFRF
jgi:hypothetical protein